MTVPSDNNTFIDVTFTPSAGNTFGSGAISGDEIVFGGFGGTGIAVTGTPLALGDNTYRFLLTGTFRPGPVTVTFVADSYHDSSSRGPPANSNDPRYSNEIVQSFTVAGATGDLVRTVPATSTTSEQTVALAGGVIGRDLLNGQHYLEIRFRASAGFAIGTTKVTR